MMWVGGDEVKPNGDPTGGAIESFLLGFVLLEKEWADEGWLKV
jgi:hypothetical protein